MRNPGRVPAASLHVAASTVEKIERPDAPYELNDEQSAEWWAIVNRMEPDWFPRETHGLLADFCRHVVKSRKIDGMISALEQELAKGDESGPAAILSAMDAFDKLYKMAERESRAASSLATRLRITQQATVRAESARKPSMAKKPWERG